MATYFDILFIYKSAAVDVTERALFAEDSTGQNLYVFNFANGAVSAASGSPVPLGFSPGSLAALQR